MARRELKITPIGNSKGVRLPADTLRRYGIRESVVMEERSDGILLRPPGPAPSKLSWADTAREMAAARENWSEWDVVLGDGLDQIPWDLRPARRVAEPRREYRRRPKRR